MRALGPLPKNEDPSGRGNKVDALLREFSDKFKISESLIRDYQYWTWSLRPVQCTLGAGILALKRYAAAFAEVSSEEMAELARVVRDVESALKAAFGFDKINYLMLMMVDPHVHFHVIPRYSSSRSFAGQEWTDPAWPRPPDLGGQEISSETRRALVEAIKKNL